MKLKDWLMDQPQDEPTNEDEKSSGENSKSKRRREMKTSPVKKESCPKYVCPKCGAGLHVYEEYFFEERRNVDPVTGELSAAYRTKPESSPYEKYGVGCNNCGFARGGWDIEEGTDLLRPGIS